MSWYAPIYTRVRLYRQKNPFRGWFLAKCLNLLLVMQVAGHFWSIYVYLIHVCGHFLTDCVQMTIYLCIYGSLSLMGFWCLMTTIWWPIEKVPDNWRLSQEKLDELKKVTPVEGERYVADKSTDEQISQQQAILTEVTKDLKIVQAECDHVGRPKLCYQCGHMKPDRTHHCSSCGFCVVRFDHHCPWINHCVNYNNYKFFLLYLLYSVFIIVWFLLGAVECLIRYFIRQQWLDDLPSLLYIASAFVPFCIFGYFPLGELLIYHWKLMCINETTCEQAKPAVLKNDNCADYNMGRWDNVRQVFGWGLWLFPLPTQVEDGMHFKIRYENPNNGWRFRRIEAPPEFMEMTPRTSAEMTTVVKSKSGSATKETKEEDSKSTSQARPSTAARSQIQQTEATSISRMAV